VITRTRRRFRPSYFFAINAWSETAFGGATGGWVPGVVGTAVPGAVVLGAVGVADAGVDGAVAVGLVARAFGVGVFEVDDEVQPVAVTRPSATSPTHDDLMPPYCPSRPTCGRFSTWGAGWM
jgi:hypothetical protein